MKKLLCAALTLALLVLPAFAETETLTLPALISAENPYMQLAIDEALSGITQKTTTPPATARWRPYGTRAATWAPTI